MKAQKKRKLLGTPHTQLTSHHQCPVEKPDLHGLAKANRVGATHISGWRLIHTAGIIKRRYVLGDQLDSVIWSTSALPEHWYVIELPQCKKESKTISIVQIHCQFDINVWYLQKMNSTSTNIYFHTLHKPTILWKGSKIYY